MLSGSPVNLMSRVLSEPHRFPVRSANRNAGITGYSSTGEDTVPTLVNRAPPSVYMHSHLKFKKIEVNSGVSAVISHPLFNYKLLIQINGYITILFLALAAPAVASSCLLLESDRPKLSTANTGPYLTSEENLARGKRLYDSGDPFYIELVEELLEEADTHLDREPYSVTYQEKGEFIEDHHDYVSFYSYAWPNPDSEDGMPWISRDGQINREQVDRYDRSYLSRLSLAVEKLSLAWVYSREEKYAEKAADFIRSWVFGRETRMK